MTLSYFHTSDTNSAAMLIALSKRRQRAPVTPSFWMRVAFLLCFTLDGAMVAAQIMDSTTSRTTTTKILNITITPFGTSSSGADVHSSSVRITTTNEQQQQQQQQQQYQQEQQHQQTTTTKFVIDLLGNFTFPTTIRAISSLHNDNGNGRLVFAVGGWGDGSIQLVSPAVARDENVNVMDDSTTPTKAAVPLNVDNDTATFLTEVTTPLIPPSTTTILSYLNSPSSVSNDGMAHHQHVAGMTYDEAYDLLWVANVNLDLCDDDNYGDSTDDAMKGGYCFGSQLKIFHLGTRELVATLPSATSYIPGVFFEDFVVVHHNNNDDNSNSNRNDVTSNSNSSKGGLFFYKSAGEDDRRKEIYEFDSSQGNRGATTTAPFDLMTSTTVYLTDSFNPVIWSMDSSNWTYVHPYVIDNQRLSLHLPPDRSDSVNAGSAGLTVTPDGRFLIASRQGRRSGSFVRVSIRSSTTTQPLSSSFSKSDDENVESRTIQLTSDTREALAQFHGATSMVFVGERRMIFVNSCNQIQSGGEAERKGGGGGGDGALYAADFSEDYSEAVVRPLQELNGKPGLLEEIESCGHGGDFAFDHQKNILWTLQSQLDHMYSIEPKSSPDLQASFLQPPVLPFQMIGFPLDTNLNSGDYVKRRTHNIDAVPPRLTAPSLAPTTNRQYRLPVSSSASASSARRFLLSSQLSAPGNMFMLVRTGRRYLMTLPVLLILVM